MLKIETGIVASQELNDYAQSICTSDMHINIVTRGTWVSGDWKSFSGRSMSDTTTYFDVVRAWSYDGKTFYTVEQWEHDNGYRCTLTVLDKQAFLTLIRS
jgi:hypothetical protein